MRGAPRERRARGRPGHRRGTRPGAGGAAHRREATAAPQGSRRSIAGSGAGLAARRARGGLATSAWAALGPAPAAARPAPVLPGRGSSRSRALALPGSPRAAAAPRRSRDPPTVLGGERLRGHVTTPSGVTSRRVTSRHVTSRAAPHPGSGDEAPLTGLVFTPRHCEAPPRPQHRPPGVLTSPPRHRAFIQAASHRYRPARVPLRADLSPRTDSRQAGRGTILTTSPGPRSVPPRAGSDGSRLGVWAPQHGGTERGSDPK